MTKSRFPRKASPFDNLVDGKEFTIPTNEFLFSPSGAGPPGFGRPIVGADHHQVVEPAGIEPATSSLQS